MTISDRVRAGLQFHRLLALACLLSLLLSSTLSAQTATSLDGQHFFTETTLSDAERARYARIRIQLMTIGPGPTYWERFGHNAIIVTDPDDEISISYNYGMFDFGQENFMLNFLRGYMVYRMDTYAGDEDIRYYLNQNRAVHLQTLNLTPLQKKQLLLFTNWNLQPENIEYRYQYFSANCSTKLRDVIDMTLGGLLQRQTASRPSSKTIRQWVRDYSDPVPWMQAGTMLGLGQDTDRPISDWQSFFLPEVLMQHLNEITVTIDGVRQPLVSKFITLSEGDIEPAGSELFLVIFWYALAGTLLAALMTLLSRTESATRWVLMIVQTIIGLLGTGLLALWLLTEHSDAYRNENLFLFSPLSLWLVWQLLRRHFSPALMRSAIILLLPAITGLLLKLTPWFYQENPEILLFILPIHLVTILLIRKRAIRSSAD